MVELVLDQACEDVSTFAKVVLLLGCQGGLNDGQPRPSAKFMEDLVMADVSHGL
jgi:hypothetical protein